jgi:radical SAM superfamily enzyme YgiQ (UPF0313 family)
LKVLFVYPRFSRHADHHPELREHVPMNEYVGSPSLGIACVASVTPPDWEVEHRDDRVTPADGETDADIVAFSMFTPAASRGMELARAFRERGHTVVAGGIFPTAMPDVVQAEVDSVVVGEGEASWVRLLEDFVKGELKPRYEPEEAVDLCGMPLPKVSLYLDAESDQLHPDDYPVQLTRGCPLTCHACVLPLSMGKKIRAYPIEHVLGQLDQLGRAGRRACLTEDTTWLPGARGRRLLDGVIEHLINADPAVRTEISYVGTSMPMLLSTPPTRLARLREAGVDLVYLVGGFDPVTTKAFTGKDEAALDRAFAAISKCREAGIEPYTSFLIGRDQDDEGTADRMLDFARKSGIRKAEFAIYTPYPGTPAWQELNYQERILSRDWSRYNDANVVFQPAQMSPDALQEAYLYLWKEFYAGRSDLANLSLKERTIQF